MEGREFDAALEGFLDRWGYTPTRGMVSLPSVPTWRENPDVVLGLVRALLADMQTRQPEPATSRQNAEFEAARKEVSSSLIAPAARLFNASLSRARNYIVAREDGFEPYGKAVSHGRQVLIRLGQLWHQSNVLDDLEDVFFVRNTELLAAVRGDLPDLRQRVARRRRGFGKVEAGWSKGENWFVASGSIPPRFESGAAPTDQKVGLRGIGASNGLATGPVCIVHDHWEFHKVTKGVVLVAPATAPAWTPLFGLAAAVVTEIGGPLSHAAIVAREYGIPAVLAVPSATTLLHEGERISVDGTTGFVWRGSNTAAHHDGG